GINGVRVEGSRAVVTHSLDGAVHRMLVRWPALAAAGHRLRTGLKASQIETRAVQALQAAGETGGAGVGAWEHGPARGAGGGGGREGEGGRGRGGGGRGGLQGGGPRDRRGRERRAVGPPAARQR